MEFGSLQDLDLAGVKWELSGQNAQNKNVNSYKSSDKKSLSDDYKPKLSANPTAVSPRPTPPIDSTDAKDIADKALNLSQLYDAIIQFNHPLKMFAKNTILPREGGNLLVITDAPSADDDESGQILSGPAGELFDKMLDAIGLSRDKIAVCPLVFWRTPGGRTLADEELLLARPFIDKFIELIKPKVILTLGPLAKDAAQGIIDEVFSIPHPNYLLLKPGAKKAAWEELQNLLKSL